MKKITAIIISALLIIAMLPIGAFASERRSMSAMENVYDKIDGARNYVFGSVSEFTYDKSADFLLYLNADGDYDKYEKAYNKSVSDAIKDGKITDAATYACIILCTDENPTKYPFEDGTEVNLVSKMEECSPKIASPYYYKHIFEVANYLDVKQSFIDDCLNELLALYTMGRGMDNWGYGCDNTANFILSASFASEVSDIDCTAQIDDAWKLLEGYKVDKGYFFNSDYGKEPNTDSTAAALTAYAIATDNDEKTFEAYDMLLNYEISGKTGVFGASSADMADNAYATKDALNALVAYYNYIFVAGGDTEEEKDTTDIVEENQPKQVTPATSDTELYIAFMGLGALAMAGAVISIGIKKKVK